MNADYTLLIVDDIEENLELLDRQIQNLGFNSLTASRGAEVLDVLECEEIDLILLDINMPVVDGITLLGNIRANSALDNVAIMMVTANEDVNTALDCLKKGACGYITKPYDMPLLKKQINHCLNITED